MIRFGLTIIVALIFFGCSKEEGDTSRENKQKSIKGFLYFNCLQVPVENYGLILQTPYELLDSSITSSDGSFSFKYDPLLNSKMSIIASDAPVGSGMIMKDISPEQNIEDLNLYFETSEIVKIVLDVKDPFTNADTLYITNSIGEKFPGPFVSGYLATDSNYLSGQMSFEGGEIRIGYMINNGPIESSVTLYSDYCGSMKSATITIE